MRPLLAFLLLALSLCHLSGCGEPAPDHFAQALAIERELLRQHPESDYSDHRYLAVMRELDQVPRSSSQAKRARKLWKRISDGRRHALAVAMPNHAASLPPRLEGKEPPRPPRHAPLQQQAHGKPSAQTGAASKTHSAAKAPALQPKSAGRQPSQSTPPAKSQALAGLDITMYSTSWCGYCRKARKWFKAKGYPFIEKDIEKDPVAHREYLAASSGYSGVPLIIVNGRPFRGFPPGAIQQEINRVLATD